MDGDQRLVGGDDRLARGQRRLHRRLGRSLRAADQLDEQVDVRIGGQGDRVVEPAIAGRGRSRGWTRLERAQTAGDYRAPAGGREVRPLGQELDQAAADRAQAGDADAPCLSPMPPYSAAIRLGGPARARGSRSGRTGRGTSSHCARPGGCGARSPPGRCAHSPRRARRRPRRARRRRRPPRSAAWRTASSRPRGTASGIGAQANIEAGGEGMSQPARAMELTSTSRRDL